jgi:predicted dehydrogenase
MPRRGALIGYGFIAENGHLPVYIERADRVGDVVITAIADVTPARRSAAHRALPSASIYASYDELLQKEASRLDFVDIATPPYCHTAIANAALDCKLHVLCEKPLALSFGQAQEMAERARSQRRVLFPCHNYRHAPVMRTMRELVQQGAIGSVRLATLQTFRTTHARGVREWRPDWRRECHFSGGGIGMDHGPHSLYLAFEWMRAYPSTVTASMSNALGVDVEETFNCTLTFPTAVATVMLTWTAGARKVMYTLHGSRGAISVDDDDIQLVLRDEDDRPHDLRDFLDKRSVSSKWMDASHKEWFGSVIDAFGRSIDDNDLVSRETLDAIECMRVISAAYASVRQGSRQINLRSPGA